MLSLEFYSESVTEDLEIAGLVFLDRDFTHISLKKKNLHFLFKLLSSCFTLKGRFITYWKGGECIANFNFNRRRRFLLIIM